MNPYRSLRLQKTKSKDGRPFRVAEMGEKLGLSASCVSKIERNVNTPTLEVVAAYRRYFRVSYDYLIDSTLPDYNRIPRKKSCRMPFLSESPPIRDGRR